MLKGLSGAKWRATHQASVDGMLHDLNVRRPVKSLGSGFSNRDRWTGRAVLTGLGGFDGVNVDRLVASANADVHFTPHIVIASTPDDLPAGTALALVGGAYHEAWHTRYSTRRTLKVSEVEAPLMERWNKADRKFWRAQHGLMMQWSNIIEDIRIERLGCAKFPGAYPKMESLQDLILKMEGEGFEKSMPENLLLTMIGCVFRDLGLGYKTHRQQAALAFYDNVCPEAVAFVEGPLRPLLDKAIGLSESEDMEPIWMAMDIALMLRELAEDNTPKDGDGSDQPSNGDEGQSKSKPENGDGQSQPKPKNGEGQPQSKPENGEGGEPSKPENDDEGEGDDDDDDEDSDGEDSDGEDSDDEDSDDDEGQSDSVVIVVGDDDGQSQSEGGEGGNSAGGQTVLTDEQVRELATALIEAVANGAKMDVKDVSQALEAAINAAFNQDLKDGEQPWRSPCPEADVVAFAAVRDAKGGIRLRNDVRKEIAALRARLRNKFLAARTPSYTHGVRKGVDLSERRMVDSIIEINMGMEPTRPDYLRDKKNDCSLAVALVIDESGSMSSLRKDTTKGAIAISDALSSLGCPILAVGPRNWHGGDYSEDYEGCHRSAPIRIDVFKDWNESMTAALPRFTGITATGGTPLEDGIQYALQELNKRSERHRIVLVLTDGVPDNPQVVRNQIRLSADAQINIVGIGLGYAGDSVGHLFPEHLSVPQIEDLPAKLSAYLEGVVFPSRAKKIEGVAKSFKAA